MGKKGVEALTSFFNKIALSEEPPEEWKNLLLTPIYKGKGSRNSCESYRGLAVMGPLAKLFMGLINLRIEEYSEANNLRAPT